MSARAQLASSSFMLVLGVACVASGTELDGAAQIVVQVVGYFLLAAFPTLVYEATRRSAYAATLRSFATNLRIAEGTPAAHALAAELDGNADTIEGVRRRTPATKHEEG